MSQTTPIYCPQSSDPRAAAWYQAGFAQVKITPPVGTSLAGFFHNRVSNRVRDELHAKAMVVEHGGRRAAIVGLDLICVDDDFVAEAKSAIAKEFGIPPERTMVSATHTHTGPEVRRVGAKVPMNIAWRDELPGRIVSAVRQAAGNMAKVTIRTGRTQAEGYVFNRIYRLVNGKEQMGQPKDPSAVLGPAGPVDSTLQTLAAVDEAGVMRGMIVNLGMHPVTVAGANADFLSADWPGAMSRNIAALYAPDTVCLFLQGNCGDINHEPYDRNTKLPRYGPAKTEQLGRALAGAAVFAHERAEPMCDARVDGRCVVIDVPYYTRTQEVWEEVAALKARGDLNAQEAFTVRAVEEWPFDGKICRVPLSVLVIGHAAFIGIPGQIFTPTAIEMKHWSPFERTMIVELANARVASYIPTADQVERGAYGSRPVISRWLCTDAARRIGDAVQVLLHQMHREA